MRFATDWWQSKTTLAALAAILAALADAAGKGALTWQQGGVILLAVLGATIRDTLAKGHEAAAMHMTVANKTLGAAASASHSTKGLADSTKSLADAMTDLVSAMTPPKPQWAQPKAMATEPEDSEADRTEETP